MAPRTRVVRSDPVLRRLTAASDEDRQKVVEAEVAAAKKRAKAEEARQWAGQRARERTPRPDEAGRADPLHRPEEIILGGTEGEAGSEEGRDIGERDITDPEELPGDIITPDKHNSNPDATPEIDPDADPGLGDTGMPSGGTVPIDPDHHADPAPPPGTDTGSATGEPVEEAGGTPGGDQPDQEGGEGGFAPEAEPVTPPTEEGDTEEGDTSTDGVLGDDAADQTLLGEEPTDDFEGTYPASGTIQEVLDWVAAEPNEEEARTTYALDQENNRPAGPRVGLLEKLEGGGA